MRATEQALREKVLVITGGPGTGKTTLLTALLTILRRAKVSFVLAAPTGRAAKRMAESAGEEAMTIHRLLEYNPREGGFQRSEDNPLEVDFVIVDETSMVDLSLMDHLLRAVDPHSHLILVGDVDQLPSVGPGSVLRDLIDSGVVPKVVLRRIFRQDRESLIVRQRAPNSAGPVAGFGRQDGDKRDFVFLARESEEEILATVKELVRESIPRSLQLEPEEVAQTIQVLTPMHRGLLGTINLNREMQSLLNPLGQTLERGGFTLRVGDKVMQLRNNYDKGVFNGDLGRIAGIDREDGSVKVDFFDKVVQYESDELDEISLAYATSVHKSQGSEYPAVVIPLHTSHYLLLHRSILYTAVTRGKKLVVLVGSRKALAMAIRNLRVEKRNTGLREKLAELAKAQPADLMLLEQPAEFFAAVADAEFVVEQVQSDGLIAVDHRFAEIALQVVDRFDHARVRAAQKIAVGVGPGIFLDDFLPFFRRDLSSRRGFPSRDPTRARPCSRPRPDISPRARWSL